MDQGSGLTLGWPLSPLPDAMVELLMGPGCPFELVEETVGTARLTVFARRPPHLRQVLVSAAEQFGDRPYLVFPDRQFTFASFLDPVAAVARSLRDNFGVHRGDRVAVAAASCAEYMLTLWATVCLGAVAVGLNGWWTGAEMSFALDLTSPRVLLGDKRRLERLNGHDLGGTPVVTFEDDFASLEALGSPTTMPDGPIDEDDPCFILFTSGTTGRPKGAILTHRNNVHFGQAMLLGGAESVFRAAEAGLAPSGPSDPGCVISASPVFHTSGLNGQIVAGTFTGITTVFPPPGRWREDVHLELTERHSATMWSLVPTQLWRLLEWPELDRYDLSSLQRVGGGGAVWPPELLRVLSERLPGVQRNIGYGSTETTAVGTGLKGDATYEHPDSVGQPNPTVEVQVRDPERGAVLGERAIGEICLRSAANFLGYWRDPEATQAALEPSGWYHTGDHGFIRDGFVYLGGRRSDLIIRGGENIYPVEVENRLAEHTDIVEAVVVGVPHPTLGQEVRAYVVARPGSGLDAEAVRSWTGAVLAPFKVPAHVTFMDELPHNASGKVIKTELIDGGHAQPKVPD